MIPIEVLTLLLTFFLCLTVVVCGLRLRAQRKRLALLAHSMDAVSEAYLTIDQRQRIRYANRTALRIFGERSQHVMGRPLGDFILAQLDAPHRDQLRQLLAQASCSSRWHSAWCCDGHGNVISIQFKAGAHRVKFDGFITLRLRETKMEQDLEDTLRLNEIRLTQAQRSLHTSSQHIEDAVERRTQTLREGIQVAEKVVETIQQQNSQLQRLANYDPMTGCLNRRAFLSTLESEWTHAKQAQLALTCIMVDVDHFKSVNDNFGHPVGDQVLKSVAAILSQAFCSAGAVCRYGGEEFCVLLPNVSMKDAAQRCQTVRQRISETDFPCGLLTASFGISCITQGANDPLGLICQADECLYRAKGRGRNCVVHRGVLRMESEIKVPSEAPAQPATPISFSSVSALVSALAFRDLATAEHCRRVADLCVNAMSDELSPRQRYVLEIAALLHDIGKIGVPDSILFKPTPLEASERLQLQQHGKIGLSIIEEVFQHPDLLNILRHYHGIHSKTSEALSDEVTRSVKILRICDAFDAMTRDQAHQNASSLPDAFAELRANPRGQFDEQLVETLIRNLTDDGTAGMEERDTPLPFIAMPGVSHPTLTDAPSALH
ncbi:Response regulator PleD [Novipirellula galeiformis]|uniref:diguanylate cyclase n=1 Tax=Novipirellula galeiformis TaxID=2528004 RepID=A0A5C6C010_9BACT|nr:diguanylate cyclase [Novipirellula galeiformis]TWU17442.1 Response regulator PleD [Novipirellula galeiformis]